MRALGWGCGLFTLVWVLHVAAWRIAVPRAGRRILFAAFLLALPAGFGAVALLSPAPAAELALGAALYGALAVAYLALYVALEGDSPTLTITGLLADAEPAGMAPADLHRALALDRHLRSRLNLMVTDGMAELVDGRYRITGKGRRLLGYFELYGRIAGTRWKAL